jgi:hypothetical protein
MLSLVLLVFCRVPFKPSRHRDRLTQVWSISHTIIWHNCLEIDRANLVPGRRFAVVVKKLA